MKTHLATLATLGLLAGTTLSPAAWAQQAAPNPAPTAAPASQAANPAGANPAGTAQTASADADFARKAAIGGITEVQLGQIAEQKGATPAVREFGRWMVTDHTLANHMLQQVAQDNSMTLPNSLDAEHQQMVNHLKSLNGAQFDRDYITHMVQDHEQDVADFRKESQDGSNAQLKQFAAQVTPILEQHLAEARELRGGAATANAQRPMNTASSSRSGQTATQQLNERELNHINGH